MHDADPAGLDADTNTIQPREGRAISLKRADYLANLDRKTPLEDNFHNLTNAIAAARSFGEVIQHRIHTKAQADPQLLESLLSELDRAGDILQVVRRETFRPGDVLQCLSCGYSFVNRKSAGKAPSCRRCKSSDVERWKGSD